MRNLLICAFAASLASTALADPVSAPVARSDAATDASSEQAPAPKDKAETAAAKKICKNIDAGFSHRTERLCLTAKQWEEYNRGE